MSVKIFLSAVSDEFRDYRDQLRRDLTRHDVEVKVQEDFKDCGDGTLDKLDLYINNCDAVVHLIGDMTGSDAKPASTRLVATRYPDIAEKLPPLRELIEQRLGVSYTQWEAWLAVYHGKKLLIAKANAAAPRGPNYAPTDSSRAAQKAHLERLRDIERYPECDFTSPDHLAKQILSSAVLDLLVKAQRPQTSLEPTRSAGPIKLAIVSHRGGVGKTTLAVNIALELASVATVVLIDCDIGGAGATNWLKQEIPDFGEKTLTLDAFVSFAQQSPDAIATSLYGSLDLAAIPGEKLPNDYLRYTTLGKLYFVPASYRRNTQFGCLPDWANLLPKLIESLTAYSPHFLIFDCSPGSNAVTAEICSNSSIGILVTPFHEDDMWQAALTLLELQHSGANSIQWRLVVNKLPTSDLYKDRRDIFEKAEKTAQDIARERGIRFSKMRTSVSAMIPDLEEFRDYYRRAMEAPLSKFRRGGNVFVLFTRILLNSLRCDELLGNAADALPYIKTDRKQFEGLKKDVEYKFVDRLGYGKAGLSRESFFISVLYAMLSITYFGLFLYTSSNHINLPSEIAPLALLMRILEGLLVFGAIIAIAAFAIYVRRAIQAHNTFKRFYPEQISEEELEKIYSEGSNRATTSNLWWPRVAWIFIIIPVTAFILIKWMIYDRMASALVEKASATIVIGGVTVLLISILAILIYALKKNVRAALYRLVMYVYRSLRRIHYR